MGILSALTAEQDVNTYYSNQSQVLYTTFGIQGNRSITALMDKICHSR